MSGGGPGSAVNDNLGHPDGFVARQSELSFLGARLADARNGALTVVAVTGEQGVGKTTLVRRFLEGLADDTRTLVASGDEAESTLAFATIAQLLSGVDEPLVAPNLTASDGSAQDPLRVGAALVALAGQMLTECATLVIVIDDIQWADTASQRALAFALRRLRSDSILCLLVMPTTPAVALTDGLLRFLAERGTPLRVRGLDPSDLRELSRLVSGSPMSTHAAERIFQLTDGNPLHARALLEELSSDALDNDAEPLPAPRSFTLVVLGRLAQCAPEGRSLTMAAAVLGRSCQLVDAARLAEIRAPLPALEQAVASSLLIEETTRLEHRIAFAHPLVRSAIYHDLGPAHRSALHLRAAQLAHDDRARLRHRITATIVPDPDLAAEITVAAERLAVEARWAAAGDLMLDAARLTPDRPTQERLFVDAVDFLLYAGELARAGRQTDHAGVIEDPARRNYLAGRLALVQGAYKESTAYLRAAWTAVDPAADPAFARTIAEQTALTLSFQGLNREAAIWGSRAMGMAGTPAVRPWQLIDIQISALIGSGQFDTARELAASVPEPYARQRDGLFGRGYVLLASDRLEAAREAFTVTATAYRQHGSVGYALGALAFLSDTEYRLGAWDDAVLHAELAASIAGDAEQHWMLPLCHAVAAAPLAGRGLAAAAEHLKILDNPGWPPDHATQGLAAATRAKLAHAAGDAEGVLAALGFFTTITEMAAPEPAWMAWRPMHAEALAGLGRPGDADRSLHPLEEAAAAEKHRSALVSCARARAAIEIARRRPAAAEDAYRDGLALAVDQPIPFERALLELGHGVFLRRSGRSDEATAALSAAQARFEALGARPYLLRCDRELAACGQAPAQPRGTDPVGSLTPQERTVTQLVCTGLSNREIAAELVRSVKTIEYHLGNVYAKLGVRSRTQLAAYLHAG
ncbi:helix-turn-helix transcriptional regulator [Frankia sp. Cas4]|uniref:helix-turn-helix transcriptional regulator n=1 Tax=Frankia sp. Cas4 TaxID=3073927 RepID=UPI002AD48098|nr:AAA family ATPase [Frankia sp. Cas4]